MIKNEAIGSLAHDLFEGPVRIWEDQMIYKPPFDSEAMLGWHRERLGLNPADDADRVALLRRVTLDLVGLPPSPAEIETFITGASPDAFEKVVDRLLASPRYGERWGRHWLDVVRFSESAGFEMNSVRPTAWHYRDWVIQAFNEDRQYPAKAKRVLLIFCTGGLSQIDSWDYKPELIRLHDRPLPGNEGLVTSQGKQGNLIKSLYPFRPRGETGKQVTDLLPRLAELTDELCFIHSMTTLSNAHGPAETQMSTGFTTDGFPSMGAWCSYALGTEATDLPAFVAIPDPRGVPQVGPIN